MIETRSKSKARKAIEALEKTLTVTSSFAEAESSSMFRICLKKKKKNPVEISSNLNIVPNQTQTEAQPLEISSSNLNMVPNQTQTEAKVATKFCVRVFESQ